MLDPSAPGKCSVWFVIFGCFIRIPVFFFNAQPVGFDFGHDIGIGVFYFDFFAADQGDDGIGRRFHSTYQIDVQQNFKTVMTK